MGQGNMADDTAGEPGNQQPDTDNANGDYLGYGVYAQTLWARVEAALNKDQGDPQKLGDDPLVVGIFGEWGAGKSKLLSLVQRLAEKRRDEQAQAHKRDDKFQLTVPVFFQPWKYEHEKHLLVPLLLHIQAELQRCIEAATPASTSLATKGKSAGNFVVKHTEAVVKAFEGVYSAARTAYQLADPASSAVLLPLAGILASMLGGKDAGAASKEMAAFRMDESSGRSYYEMHDIFKAITRPTPERIKRHLPKVAVSSSFRINFVIFIDDLDRCLPEKTVETLELIKTVFNLESFAFVLALDEEVVERGIGHRYKDYALNNKKPEMPITGFEYLEKIVHLPFRLPGLTKNQARRFLQRYEENEVAPKAPDRWWFAQRPAALADPDDPAVETKIRQPGQQRQIGDADLINLVLNSFTAYVPRKLVRLVELLHQVQEVALRGGKVFTVGGTSGADVRVVAALVMLQLFQPDLYRLVRRRPQAFPLLLAAFATRAYGYRQVSDPAISDVDLWLWVVDESAGDGNDWIQTSDVFKAIDAVVSRIAKKFHVVTEHGVPVRYQDRTEQGEEVTATEYDTVVTREQRFRAQNIKLPLVAQIVEHRATQRHAFDPLRLFHALAGALEKGWDSKQSGSVSPALEVTISDYFELMVVKESADQSLTIAVTATGSGSMSWPASAPLATQPMRYPDRLLADLTSEQPEVQANLVANNELEPGKVLEPKAAQHLLQQLQGWQKTHNTEEDRALLTRGLQVIAPFVPPDLGRSFLALVDSPEQSPFFVPGTSKPYENTAQIAHAVNRAELWTTLGQDDRFDQRRVHLPKLHWHGHTPEQEPIVGFVRVPKGHFTLGAGGKGFEDNPKEIDAEIKSDFYIARYLTTVEQYAHFVAQQGYGDPAGKKPVWWDTLGWAWRTGQWDSQVKDKRYRENLARRKPELRGLPTYWDEQRSHGSSPVMWVNWFEARAYANWLTLQLRGNGELGRLPAGYAARLPTEAQWERAARAKSLVEAGESQFPWGSDEEESAHLNSNIDASSIGRVSPVGLFAPNPLGLCDLSGNVWEWQNNLYQPDGSGQGHGPVTDVEQLKAHDDFDECDRPALRGGAWDGAAGLARASIRYWAPPGYWYLNVGFRVVLSLAE